MAKLLCRHHVVAHAPILRPRRRFRKGRIDDLWTVDAGPPRFPRGDQRAIRRTSQSLVTRRVDTQWPAVRAATPCSSDVEAELDDVAVLHDVVLALHARLS